MLSAYWTLLTTWEIFSFAPNSARGESLLQGCWPCDLAFPHTHKQRMRQSENKASHMFSLRTHRCPPAKIPNLQLTVIVEPCQQGVMRKREVNNLADHLLFTYFPSSNIIRIFHKFWYTTVSIWVFILLIWS